QQLTNHQSPGGVINRLLAAFRRVILQLLGHRFRSDRHLVDADDRPLLLTAGDQLRRGVVGRWLKRQGCKLLRYVWRQLGHLGLRLSGRTAATAAPITAATSTST